MNIKNLKNFFESKQSNSINNNKKTTNLKNDLDKNNKSISNIKKDPKKKEDDDENFEIQKSQTILADNPVFQKLKMQKSEVKLKIPNKDEQPNKKESQFKKNESARIIMPEDLKKEEKNSKNIKDNKVIKDYKDKKEKNNNIKEYKEKTIRGFIKENINNKNNKDNKDLKEEKNDKNNDKKIIDIKNSKNNIDKKENKKEDKNVNKDNKNDKKEQKTKNNEEKKNEIKKESKENDKNIDLKEEYFQNLDDFNNFKQKKLRYSLINIDKVNSFFKERYIEEKLNEIEKTIKQKIKITRQKSSSINDSNYERENEKRKCNTEFLLIKEKAIISFNLKKYEESFNYLKNSGVIKNEEEFGEFLLVISGFDKFILGEFLAKEKKPNDKKLVLTSFINSIEMDYKSVNFLDCLRFLLSRLVLPKDANLILVIMETFSELFYEKNKRDEEFISIFKNNDAIYLLISTILALNTMFTRKDIKNMNVIKKEEFKSMNKDIEPSYADELYEKLKKDPISLNLDYNEDIYKKLSTLAQVKTKDINSKKLDTLKRVVTINKEKEDSSNSKKESKENINNNKKETEDNNNESKNNNNIEENIMDPQYYEFIQEIMDVDIVRKTLRESYNRKNSFIVNINLINFNDDDQKLLTKPNKFYRIQGSSSPILREFIVFDEFKKLAFDKTIDVTKSKYKKYIEISDINEVYLGIDYSENIKKYIKAYPQDKQLPNNFITIIYNNHKEQLDIKSDDTNLAIIWFKALKSLTIKTKNMDENKKISNSIEKLKEIRDTITDIWEKYILTHWGDYMRYIYVKIYEKSNYFQTILSPAERQAKIDLLDDKKTLNAKTIEEFLKEVKDRLNKNQNNKLEYHEFFCLCYLGFPQKIRKNIWNIGIENNLEFTKNLYLYYQEGLNKKKIDFSELDNKYINSKDNSNIQFNPDYKINQIILDIIKIRYIFLQEIRLQKQRLEEKQNLDENVLMKKVYNITVSFILIRGDIPYNKGIVSLAYFFLLTGLDEINCFIWISNLICSRNIYKLYLGQEESIKKYTNFFSQILQNYAEKVYEHLKKLEISPELYLIPWFESLFTQSLDYQLLLHVFDLYIFNGDYILFQTALTYIKLVEEDLLNLTVSEVFKMFKRLPIKYTELDFFEVFKSYNCIREEYIIRNKNNLLKLQKQEIENQIKKDIYDNSIKEIASATKNEK